MAVEAYMVLEDVLREQSASSLANEAGSSSAQSGSRGAHFWLVELDSVIVIPLRLALPDLLGLLEHGQRMRSVDDNGRLHAHSSSIILDGHQQSPGHPGKASVIAHNFTVVHRN